MKVLVIDIGGTFVKILATGQKEPQSFPSGPSMTPRLMVAGVRKLAKDWEYDVVSIGYPGPVVNDRIVREPNNLGPGWARFDFKAAFKCPVKVINDAAMQALGSYRGGTMLFLGLGTGLGSALMIRGHIVPLELAQLTYKRGIVEDYLGIRGLKRMGKRKWREAVSSYVERLIPALMLDDSWLRRSGVAETVADAGSGGGLDGHPDVRPVGRTFLRGREPDLCVPLAGTIKVNL
jgi:predicted NBD/HSP70 family sugar kinase